MGELAVEFAEIQGRAPIENQIVKNLGRRLNCMTLRGPGTGFATGGRCPFLCLEPLTGRPCYDEPASLRTDLSRDFPFEVDFCDRLRRRPALIVILPP